MSEETAPRTKAEEITRVGCGFVLISMGLLFFVFIAIPAIRVIFHSTDNHDRNIVTISEIQRAIEVYHSAYNRPPTGLPPFIPTETTTDDQVLIEANRLLFGALTGTNTNLNPRGTVFCDVQYTKDSTQNMFLDRDGLPLRIKLDEDGDRTIRFKDEDFKMRSIVWSVGPNGVNDWGFKDDITALSYH